MKKQQSLLKPVFTVGGVTLAVLMVPLIAMQFTQEVKWDIPDFVIMGALIFGTGMTFALLMRQAPNTMYKLAMTLAIASGFLMIWANLAVGLIGSGPNPANLMYGGVLFIGAAGAILTRFRTAGMERAMYAMVISLALVAFVTILLGVHLQTDSSVGEVLAINGFFAALFGVAGMMFRIARPQLTN